GAGAGDARDRGRARARGARAAGARRADLPLRRGRRGRRSRGRAAGGDPVRTSLVIHGHFYQPPRENPWTGAIERESSAHPDHDWNERIHRECYRANAFARVLDEYGRVERIVNNYEHLSFNFGPTLLSWLEHHDPDTYARILAADRA